MQIDYNTQPLYNVNIICFIVIFKSFYNPKQEIRMTEKYKIYLTEETKNRLIDDAELFEFFKSDGKVNLNSFLKELIVNYFEQYREDGDELIRSMADDIASVKSLKPKDARDIAGKIIRNYINNREPSSGRSSVITLTVSGESYGIIKIIENNALMDSSLSGYLKDMFLSYLSIPRSKREEIIFADTYRSIGRAIDTCRLLSFTSGSSEYHAVVEPYMTVISKDEQCSYLLCRDPRTRKYHSYRISRLSNVFVTSDTFVRDESAAEELRARGMRSPHSVMPAVHAVIRMTEHGRQMYKVIVKNRPAVTSVEGDLYHFDWPELQLVDYFKRFGKDAIAVSPRSLRSKLRNYYEVSLEAYGGTVKRDRK